MNSLRYKLLLVLCLFVIGSCDNETTNIDNQEIENLVAYSKVFGYVKYFHPSDEAQQINWDKLAILGVEEVKNAKSSNELKVALDSLFTAIAPTITFSKNEPDSSLFLPDYIGSIESDTTNLKTVAWQHSGVNLGQKESIYTSIRINRDDTVWNTASSNPDSTDKLFEEHARVGETASLKLSDELWIQVPLALFSKEGKTFPESSEKGLNRLKQQLSSIDLYNMTAEDLNLRVANVIIAWNELQHFYPYFETVGTDWEEQLSLSIKNALRDETPEDFYKTLSSMLAAAQDGHIFVRLPYSFSNEATMPFLIDWIEEKVVVTHSFHKEIQPGDVVISLNGEPATEIVQNQKRYLSGSPQLTLFRSLRQFTTGRHGTEANLQVERDEEVKTYTVRLSSLRTNHSLEKDHLPISGQIEDGIYYVDLDRAPMSIINDEMEQIASSPAVIFDMRGYPNSNHQVIEHLLTSPDTSDQWMKIPKIIYPDQQNRVGFQKFGWQLEPATPHIKGDVIFITDARAISAAESYMSFIEHYNLAEIVGQPTAGTNGNGNILILPGGYHFEWTGMKVTKHDGSQHHLIGIQPTIPVQKTIQGVRDGRDEFLETAIQILKRPL